MPTTEIRAEWAAQRIKGLSFFSAAKAAFFGNKGNKIKTLIDKFHYPRYGPGQMWETMTERIEELGGEVLLDTPVEQLVVEDGQRAQGDRRRQGVRVQLRDLVAAAAQHGRHGRPAPRPRSCSAGEGLRYRDFLTVALVLDGEDLFPDNWIYIHEPDVEVGRIQNYRSWSPWMVPDPEGLRRASSTSASPATSCGRWTTTSSSSSPRASSSSSAWRKPDAGRRGFVIRVPKAYPMYDADYAERVAAIRDWLDGIENLQQVGRNGLHRYNNSDHSMLTAMRAVDNLVEGHRPRHLGRQRRVGLPRGGAGRAAALHRGARDRSTEGAAAPLTQGP